MALSKEKHKFIACVRKEDKVRKTWTAPGDGLDVINYNRDDVGTSRNAVLEAEMRGAKPVQKANGVGVWRSNEVDRRVERHRYGQPAANVALGFEAYDFYRLHLFGDDAHHHCLKFAERLEYNTKLPTQVTVGRLIA